MRHHNTPRFSHFRLYQFLNSAARFLRRRVWPLLLMLLAGCSFKEPVLPTWTVPVTVPLAQESFQLGEEIVNDSTIVVQGADSIIHISFDGNLDTLDLSARDFSLSSLDTSEQFSLGNLHLNSLSVLSTGPITLRSLFPELENLILPGQSIPVLMPDTTIAPPPSVLDAGDFAALHVVSGGIRVRFVNFLPFPLGPNAASPQGIQVTVTDSAGQQITQLNLDGIIPPGAAADTVAQLGNGGTWIYSPLTVQYIVPVAQPTTFQLDATVLDTTRIDVDVQLENLVVDEARANIEAQDVESSIYARWDNRNRLRRAVIDRGRLQLNITNNTPLNSTLEITIPNFRTVGDSPYFTTLSLAQGQSSGLDIVLDGMSVANAADPNAFVDSLEIHYRALTEASQGMLHIRSSDNFGVIVQADSLFFRSFSGFIVADTFDIAPFEQDSLVDYQDFPNNIQLNSVDLGLSLSNEVFIENMFADITLVGMHHEGATVTDTAVIRIEHTRINPGQPGNPGVSVINLSGAQMADFLNILPTAIRASGRICASGNVEISNDSHISGRYSFSTPLRFSIEGDAVVEGDVETIEASDIDADVRNAADENLEQASVALQITNGTPIGGSLRLIVSADPDHVDLYDSSYFNPNLEFIKEAALQAAPTDPVTGFVTQPLTQEVHVNLTRQEFQLFNNPPLRVGFLLRISDTNGVVTLRSTDAVRASGLAQITVKIKN